MGWLNCVRYEFEKFTTLNWNVEWVQWEKAEETRKIQNCLDPSGQEILCPRVLQGHSGRKFHWSWNAGQCSYSEQFLRVHLSHRKCNQFTLHHEFRIDTVRTIWAKDRRSSFCLWNFWTKNTRILEQSTSEHRVLRKLTWKHRVWHVPSEEVEETVYWVDIKLALRKGFKFHQTRSNAIIFYDTLPASCIPKAIMMDGKVI